MISADMREEFTSLLHAHVPGLHVKGDQANGYVPWREDEHPSLNANLAKGVWYDRGRGEGGNIKEFKARLELNGTGYQQRKIEATYDYHDEQGVLVYQAVRRESKKFTLRRPDGKGGWIESKGCMSGVQRVLYALHELKAAETIFVVEGEKDANRLRALGLTATTNSEGAGKWRAEYSQDLAGKHVLILPDNDDAGEQHAWQVARFLLPVAASAKLIRLPSLPHKGDVSDWLDQGHTREELVELVEAAPVLKLEDLSPEQKPRSDSIVLTKLSDLLNEPEEQVNWLVDQLLPAGGFSLLVAKPKAGKSTLARNLALCLGRKYDFLNRATAQGPVIYLALEEKRSEVKKHFRDMGATGEEDIYIHAASAPVDALKQIRAVAEEKKPVLIIIDPLFKLARIKDGNDYAQVTQALEPLLVLARETGAHVLCVHHAGKGEREGGDSILGSTAIFAAVDTAIMMKRTERYRTISSIQRYGEDLPETVLRFDPQTRTIALGATKEQEEGDRIANGILVCLKAQEEDQGKGHALTQAELEEEVEGKTLYKRRALKALVDGKQIERTGKGGKGDPFRYCLKNSRFLVPLYSKEHGNKNPQNGATLQEDGSYSCSRASFVPAGSTESRERESGTYEEEL